MIPTSSDPVGTLVFFLLVFTVVGVVFLFFHLLMGSLIRPSVPDKEKLTIYECGEPTVGSAWIQFDLRFYVVALLFVIFDVEVAFFFPWATVFGKVNQLANMPPVEQRATKDIPEGERARTIAIETERMRLSTQLMPSGVSEKNKIKMGLLTEKKGTSEAGKGLFVVPITPEAASAWATIAFFDLLAFFGVLMVGFAYLWRRGDIDWIRAFVPHQEPHLDAAKPLEQNVGG